LRSHHIPADENELLVIVHVVLALSQSQVLVFHHVSDEYLSRSGASSERTSEGDLICKFLLQRIEKSVGDADVARHVFSVIGGHAHETHGVYEYFLHRDILKL